jgi:hypothetical protein
MHNPLNDGQSYAGTFESLLRQTARLWRKHHFTYNQTTYDQTKHVVEQGCRELRLEGPPNGRSALLCRNFGLRYLKASFKELGIKLLPVCNDPSPATHDARYSGGRTRFTG